MPAALLPQQRQCGLNYPERTEVVRVKHGANVGLARFLNRADQSVTGIIEDDVKLAEMRVSLPKCAWACRTAWGCSNKVRKTPRDLAQTRIYATRCGFLRLPKSGGFQAAFRRLILGA